VTYGIVNDTWHSHDTWQGTVIGMNLLDTDPLLKSLEKGNKEGKTH